MNENNSGLTSEEQREKAMVESHTKNDICLRPDIYLEKNNEDCSRCEYYRFCICRIKVLKGEKKNKHQNR